MTIEFSVLGQVFKPVRFRSSRGVYAGSSIPALYHHPVRDNVEPYVVSNARGGFVFGRQKGKYVRLSFSKVTISGENSVLPALYAYLKKASFERNWSNRCISLSEATDRMQEMGFPVGTLVVSPSFLEGEQGGPVTLDDAKGLMSSQGFVAKVQGLPVLVADLPSGGALLFSQPEKVGCCVRTGDWLGLLVQHVDRSIVLVGDELS